MCAHHIEPAVLACLPYFIEQSSSLTKTISAFKKVRLASRLSVLLFVNLFRTASYSFIVFFLMEPHGYGAEVLSDIADVLCPACIKSSVHQENTHGM